MNHIPVVKLSSIGKGIDSDLANARYIGRFGTLEDEFGRTIAKKDIKKAVLERHKTIPQGQKKTSFRVIVSLPVEKTDEARQIVRDVIKSRYGTMLLAGHDKNDKGDDQPHEHNLIFNDTEHHPLKRLQEVHDLKQEIGEQFRAAGISFSPSKTPEFSKTQAEIHIKDRAEIEKEMRDAFSFSMYLSRDIDDWKTSLIASGLSISRETKSGILTLQNSQGYKMRLERISSGKMKTREDISRYLSINNQQKKGEKKMELSENLILKLDHEGRAYTVKWGKLYEAEDLFSANYARRAAALSAAGLTPEQIQQRLDPNPMPDGDQDNLKDRWTLLKIRKDALEKGLSREDLYSLEADAKKKNIDLSKAASGLNPQVLSKIAEGNPLPLLFALAQIITPMVQAWENGSAARKIKEETEKIREGNTFAERAAMDIYMQGNVVTAENVLRNLDRGAWTKTEWTLTEFSDICAKAKDEKNIDLKKIVANTDKTLKLNAINGAPLPLIDHLIREIWGDGRDISRKPESSIPPRGSISPLSTTMPFSKGSNPDPDLLKGPRR